jgi:hypothetical protein
MENGGTSKPEIMKHAAIKNPRSRQEELGQFLTASPVAYFMASMFGRLTITVPLQDAGAGAGSHMSALDTRLCKKNGSVRAMKATFYELTPEILPALSATMRECEHFCGEAAIRLPSPFMPQTSSRRCRHSPRVICSVHCRPSSMPPSQIRLIAKPTSTPQSGVYSVRSASKLSTSTPPSSPATVLADNPDLPCQLIVSQLSKHSKFHLRINLPNSASAHNRKKQLYKIKIL